MKFIEQKTKTAPYEVLLFLQGKMFITCQSLGIRDCIQHQSKTPPLSLLLHTRLIAKSRPMRANKKQK